MIDTSTTMNENNSFSNMCGSIRSLKINYLLKKYRSFLIIILVIFSCSSSVNNTIIIDPRTFVENKITLSDIADDISYYPLDDSILFTNFKYVITPYSIYISAKGIGILRFDRKGKLITKIGSRGKGPGEFWYGMDFTVDEITGNVFVLDRTRVKVYSQSGIFLRDISYKGFVGGYGMACGIEIYNYLLFIPDDIPTGDSKYIWTFLDTLGNFVSKKDNSIPLFTINIEMRSNIYKFKDKLFYYNFFNDTIFSISPNLSYGAAYFFARGDHRWPGVSIETNSQAKLNPNIDKLFLPVRMFETNRFIVILYSYLNRAAISFIEKKTRKNYLAMKYEEIPGSSTKTLPSLMNDLDGGLPLWDINYYFENDTEYISTLVNPYDLIVHISGDEFKTSSPKYPEKKKNLEKLANNLKETDNPILVLVKLKK
jgi:hypothetical protein